MNSNRQAVAGKDGYFELSETIKAFVDHTCLWNFYMISFMLMEQSDVKIHMIHSLADDKIPFCPYFIIPYVLWYFFLIGTVIYFAVFCPSKRILSISRNSGCRYDTVSADLLCISNGQHLRPDLGSTGGGVFISVIRFCIKLIHLPIFSQACMYLMQQQAVSPYIKMNGAGK